MQRNPDVEGPIKVYFDNTRFFSKFKEIFGSLTQPPHPIHFFDDKDSGKVTSQPGYFISVVVDRFIDDQNTSSLKVSSSPSIGHEPCLAYQRHFISRPILEELQLHSPFSLGRLRTAAELMETVTREISHVTWSSDAIRRSDFGSGPVTGLTVEESCQIMRYIGESNRLEHVRFEIPTDAQDDRWLECYAIMMWYLTEGIGVARSIQEQEHSSMQQLVLTMEQGDVCLRRSEVTGRYWMQSDSSFIPIHASEYQLMKTGVLPKRLELYLVE